MSIVRTTVGLAGACYATNAALGLSVAMGLVDASGARWVHHGLFVATASSTALALALGAAQRDPSALALGVAVLPPGAPAAQGITPAAAPCTHRRPLWLTTTQLGRGIQFVFRETCESPQTGWDEDTRPAP